MRSQSQIHLENYYNVEKIKQHDFNDPTAPLWQLIIKGRAPFYVYGLIVTIIVVIINAYFIINFLYPAAEIAREYSVNLGNYTVIYKGMDFDNNNTGVVLETDRYLVEITVINQTPSNVTLYYADVLHQANPSPTVPLEPMTITEDGSQSFNRIFYLQGGINALDGTFDMYTANKYSGKMWPSPQEIGKAEAINLATVRALTESEYEGRYVLIATVVLAEATIGLVIVSQLNVKETRDLLIETREGNRLLSLELKGKFKILFDFKEIFFSEEKTGFKFGTVLYNAGNVAVRNISIYHTESSKLITLDEIIKEEKNIKKNFVEKVDSTLEPGRHHLIEFLVDPKDAKNEKLDYRVVIWLEYESIHGKEEGIAFIDRYINGQTGFSWFDNEVIVNKRK